jgi:hypothetical protein
VVNLFKKLYKTCLPNILCNSPTDFTHHLINNKSWNWWKLLKSFTQKRYLELTDPGLRCVPYFGVTSHVTVLSQSRITTYIKFWYCFSLTGKSLSHLLQLTTLIHFWSVFNENLKRNLPVSFAILFVHLFTCNNSRTAKHIFIKFSVKEFYWYFSTDSHIN